MGGHGQEPVLGCAQLRRPPGRQILGSRGTEVRSNSHMGVTHVRLKTARLDEVAQGLGADKKGSLERPLAEGPEEGRSPDEHLEGCSV